MPLFGKKKESEKSPGKGYPTQPSYPTQQPAYPTQQPAYPTQQPGYPTQQPGYPTQPYPAAPQQAPSYGSDLPPPYTPHPVPHPSQGAYGPPPPGAHAPMPHYPTQLPGGGVQGGYMMQMPPGPVHGSFDAGARFGAGAGVNVPPPPPGHLPNMAQYAAAQGQQVVMQQQKAGWLDGGSGAGFTL